METNITLGDSPNFRVQVDAAALDVRATDVLLDAQHRRKSPNGHRRALVHDEGDALTANFGNDYPGGLWLNDAVVILRQTKIFLDEGPLRAQLAGDGEHGLPENARIGQLVLRIIQRRRGEDPIPGATGQKRTITDIGDPEASLWVCVPPTGAMDKSRTAWRQIQLGEPVTPFRAAVGIPPTPTQRPPKIPPIPTPLGQKPPK